MAGELQPLDEKFAIVGEDGRPTPYFIKWAQQRQIDIGEATSADQVTEIVAAYVTEHLKWGEITGDIADQADLQAALGEKANLAGGNAFTGNQTIAGFVSIDGATTTPGDGDLIVHGTPFPTIILQHSGAAGSGDGGIFSMRDSTGHEYAYFVGYDLPGSSLLLFATNGLDLYGIVTAHNDLKVPDEVYGVGWNGSLEVPTKNALYDKIESLTPGGGHCCLPVVDGSVPPNLVYLDDGSLVYAEIP